MLNFFQKMLKYKLLTQHTRAQNTVPTHTQYTNIHIHTYCKHKDFYSQAQHNVKHTNKSFLRV